MPLRFPYTFLREIAALSRPWRFVDEELRRISAWGAYDGSSDALIAALSCVFKKGIGFASVKKLAGLL